MGPAPRWPADLQAAGEPEPVERRLQRQVHARAAAPAGDACRTASHGRAANPASSCPWLCRVASRTETNPDADARPGGGNLHESRFYCRAFSAGRGLRASRAVRGRVRLGTWTEPCRAGERPDAPGRRRTPPAAAGGVRAAAVAAGGPVVAGPAAGAVRAAGAHLAAGPAAVAARRGALPGLAPRGAGASPRAIRTTPAGSTRPTSAAPST